MSNDEYTFTIEHGPIDPSTRAMMAAATSGMPNVREVRAYVDEDDLHPAIEDWFDRRLEFMPCDDDLEMHDALLMAAHAISASLNAHPTLANVKAIAAALGIGDDGGRVIDGEIARKVVND